MRMTVSFQRRAGNCIWARSYTSESEQSKGNWPGLKKKFFFKQSEGWERCQDLEARKGKIEEVEV